MLKNIFIIFLLTISYVAANCQVRRLYLDANNNVVSDSSKARSYFLITKFDTDSAWQVKQYSMNNLIMLQGTYKDSQLQIPHGKFIYYNSLVPVKMTPYNYITHKPDTITIPGQNYRSKTGCFLNGKMEGKWFTYNTQGNLMSINTYKNDALNGLYQSFNQLTGNVMTEGEIINNVREGQWHNFGTDGNILQTDFYKGGKVIKAISHIPDKKFQDKITEGKPHYNIINYLNERLARNRFNSTGEFRVLYSFTLSIDGKLVRPSALKQSNLEIDTAIIDLLLSAPKWRPAVCEKEPIEINAAFSFDILLDSEHKIYISYPPSTPFRYN